MSLFTQLKASRLFAEGRILIRCEYGRMAAVVRGDHDVYTVSLDERGRAHCDCPSWKRRVATRSRWSCSREASDD